MELLYSMIAYIHAFQVTPSISFAFKMILDDQTAEAKVLDVLWAPSKDGYLKPRIQIEPIDLGGVTITYATGFNAAFIEKNKINVGAVVEIVRSGDVILTLIKLFVLPPHRIFQTFPTFGTKHMSILC